MSTSNAIISASQDRDLQERFVAMAAEQGVTDPQSWVASQAYALACAPVNETGDKVADVYEYSESQYQAKLAGLVAPGKDPSAVTDDQLRHAIGTLKG